MTGDARSRSCSQCRLRVYNLSAMTTMEAEQLIEEKEGRLCVRFYRRADRTVITADCPVGLHALRIRAVKLAAGAAALAAGLFAYLGLRQFCRLYEPRMTMGLMSARPAGNGAPSSPALMGESSR